MRIELPRKPTTPDRPPAPLAEAIVLHDVNCSVCGRPLDHALAVLGRHLEDESYLCRPRAVAS